MRKETKLQKILGWTVTILLLPFMPFISYGLFVFFAVFAFFEALTDKEWRSDLGSIAVTLLIMLVIYRLITILF